MASIEKLEKDIEKTKVRISELQKRLRSMEAQKNEEENLRIAQLVKTVNLDTKQLTVFLKAYARGEIILPEKYLKELKDDDKND